MATTNKKAEKKLNTMGQSINPVSIADERHADDGTAACVRINDPNRFRTLLEMGLDEKSMDVVDELTRDFLLP